MASLTVAEADRFLRDARRNRWNAALLDRLPDLKLPDCWLVAGCLFQTVWNLRSGAPPEAQIADYDVFYFDDRELGYEAEDRQIGRVGEVFRDLPVRIELRNQARVHLWFADRFGADIEPLRSSGQSIGRFLVAGTCMGVGCSQENRGDVAAPFGLADIYAGILRPNPHNPTPTRFADKARSYRSRWPWLEVAAGSSVRRIYIMENNCRDSRCAS